MKTRHRTEITIETSRMLIVRQRRNNSHYTCLSCGGSPMFTPEEAAALAGIKTRALYRLIEIGGLHFIETPAGSLLVCLSLLPPPAGATGPADDHRTAMTHEPPVDIEPVDIEVERGPVDLVRLEGLLPSSEALDQTKQAGPARARARDWVLTADAFDRLLACLDPDRERAGERYENLRRKLIKYFECRGCLAPEEYADETINRVARRMSEGKQIWTTDPASYFYGVARNVMREYWASPDRDIAALECLPPMAHPPSETDDLLSSDSEKALLARQMDSLDHCMNELPAESRELLIEYYRGEKGDKIRNRKMLARRLGIPPNALRIRVHRIREKLERCVNESLNCLSSR